MADDFHVQPDPDCAACQSIGRTAPTAAVPTTRWQPGEQPVVLVLSYSDRSAIISVWGPFDGTGDATTFRTELEAATEPSGIWEILPLRNWTLNVWSNA